MSKIEFGFSGVKKKDEKIGKSFWGPYGDIEGDAPLYEIKKAVAAGIAKSNLKGFGVVVEAFNPDLIRKAYLDPGFGAVGYAQEIQKARNEFVNQLNEIKKADLISAGFDVNQIKKAADSTSNLMHGIYDQELVNLFMRPLPVQALIGKEPNPGKKALWDAIPAGGAGTAGYGPESPNLVDSDTESYPRDADIKIGWTTFGVTQFSQIAGLAQTPTRDLMSIEMLAHTEMLKQIRERRTLGVTTEYSADPVWKAADKYEPPGLYELITANTDDPNYITADSGVDTWDELKQLIRSSNRMMLRDGLLPNVGICDYSTFDIILNGLDEYVRYQQNKDQSWGIENITINLPGSGKVPVVPSIYLPTTTGANGSFFLTDLNRIKYRVLYPEIFTELAQANNPTKRYTISFAETLVDYSDIDGESSLQGGVFGITV